MELFEKISVFVSIIGFGFLYFQLRKMEALNSSGSLQFLYYQTAAIREHLIQNDELIPYFRSKLPIEDDNPNYDKAVIIAELYLNYFENLVSQKVNLKSSECVGWCKIIDDVFTRSPVVRKQYVEKYDWYSSELHDYVKNSKTIKLT